MYIYIDKSYMLYVFYIFDLTKVYLFYDRSIHVCLSG